MVNHIRFHWLNNPEKWFEEAQLFEEAMLVSRGVAESLSALVYYPVYSEGKRNVLILFADRISGRYAHSVKSLIDGMKAFTFALAPTLDSIRERLFEETQVHLVYRRPPNIVTFLKSYYFPLTSGASRDTVWIAGQALKHWTIKGDQLFLVFNTSHGLLEVELDGIKMTNRRMNLLVRYTRLVNQAWQKYYRRINSRLLEDETTSRTNDDTLIRERQEWLRAYLMSRRGAIDEIIRAHSSDFVFENFWEECWQVLRMV